VVVDLRPTEEQDQLRDALRRLFDRRLARLVDELPDPPSHDSAADMADAVTLGLTGLGLPEECGGAGTFADLVIAHEEIGRGLGGPLFVAVADAGRLLRHASGEPRDELLSSLADGRRTATTAFDGADGTWTRVVAGPDVTDVLVVDDTDVLAMPADRDGVAWQEASTGCDFPAWTLHVSAGADGEPRLTLDEPGRQLVRAEIAVLSAARQLGGGRAVLERTIEHVKTREQFDRAIGTFQAVQHQLADLATDLDAVALAVAQAAWAVDATLTPSERCRLANIAALTASAAFQRATLVAHQLHGGMGFVLDSPLHLWSARAIADPSVSRARRDVLDDLATAAGITADGVTAPPDHRLSPH
jgi:alkylation response protein AidB-like acyl-CoA dehydrogenase